MIMQKVYTYVKALQTLSSMASGEASAFGLM